MKIKREWLTSAVFFCLALLLVMGCSGPEEKKLKFFNKGKALYEKGQMVDAKLEFKNAIQIDPKYADAYYMLGMVELRTGNFNGAFTYFRKTAELQPKHLKAQIELGRLLLGSQMIDEAQEKASLVLTEDPKNVDGIILQSAIYLAKKDTAQARNLMEGLVNRGESAPDTFIMLALALKQSGDSGAEENALLKGIAANPRSINLHLILADYHMRQKRMVEAVADMKKVIGIEPDNLRYRTSLARLYWESGKAQEAAEVLKAITAANPQKEEAWIYAGGFYLQYKKHEEAEREFKAGIQQNKNSFKIRFALSELYANTGRMDQAVTILKECLGLSKESANPDIIQTKNALAKIALARQDIIEAKKYVDEVIKESPKNTEAIFIRGTIYLSQGDAIRSIADLRTVVTDKPQFILGHIRLAEAHTYNGEVNLAMDTLKAALRIDPKSRDLNRTLAKAYAIQKNPKEAETILRMLLQANPNDLEVQFELGDIFMSAGDFKRAEELYVAAKNSAPNTPVGYVKVAQANMAQGKWDRAVAELNEAMRLNPQAENTTALLAQVYLKQKKPASAVALVEARITKNPQDAFAFNLLGEIQISQRNFVIADENFRKAMAMQARWIVPHNNLVNSYLIQGRKDEALKELEAVIKANPDNHAAYMSIAQIYVSHKEYKKAMQAYERVLARKPGMWAAANDLAYLISEKGGDLDKALALAQKSLVQRPEEPVILDTIGWIFFKKGDFNKAIEYLERARSRAATVSPSLNYHLGAAYAKVGMTSAAREYLKKAVSSAVDFIGKEEAQTMLKRS
jgi:tetratricopeptide (TPR) repeat protein